MDQMDKERIEMDETINSIESLIYNGRDMIESEIEKEDEKERVVSDEEVKIYNEKFDNMMNELYENVEEKPHTLEELKEKHKEIKNIVNIIHTRRRHITEREGLIKQFEKFIDETRTIYKTMDNLTENSKLEEQMIKEEAEKAKKQEIQENKESSTLPEEEKKDDVNENENEFEDEFVEVEDVIEDEGKEKIKDEKEELRDIWAQKISIKVRKLCEEAENWLNDRINVQSQLKGWEEPAFTKKDIETRVVGLYESVTKIIEEAKGQSMPDLLPKNAKSAKSSSSKDDKQNLSSSGENKKPALFEEEKFKNEVKDEFEDFNEILSKDDEKNDNTDKVQNDEKQQSTTEMDNENELKSKKEDTDTSKNSNETLPKPNNEEDNETKPNIMIEENITIDNDPLLKKDEL